MDTIVLTKEKFDSLLEYSCSIPTGTTIGKQWKKNIYAFRPEGVKEGKQEWYLCEYVPHLYPKFVGISYKKIVGILKPKN